MGGYMIFILYWHMYRCLLLSFGGFGKKGFNYLLAAEYRVFTLHVGDD